MDSKLKLFAETLHPIEVKLVRAFAAENGDSLELDDTELVSRSTLEPAQVRTAVEWLKAKDVINLLDTKTSVFVSLTDVGERAARVGLPEILILEVLSEVKSAALGDLFDLVVKRLPEEGEPVILQEEIQPACGALRAAGCVAFAEGGIVVLSDNGIKAEPLRERQLLYRRVRECGRLDWSLLSAPEREFLESSVKKRGKAKGGFRLEEKKLNSFQLSEHGRIVLKGLAELGITGEEIQELTPELIASGEWKREVFVSLILA